MASVSIDPRPDAGDHGHDLDAMSSACVRERRNRDDRVCGSVSKKGQVEFVAVGDGRVGDQRRILRLDGCRVGESRVRSLTGDSGPRRR